MRVKSERLSRNGGWIHILEIAPPFYPSFKNPAKNEKKHAEETSGTPPLDGVYSTLLRGHLVLAKEHRENLRRRGLSDSEIERNGYRSVPDTTFSLNVSRALSIYDLKGVPGFYFEHGVWRMNSRGPGFFIPVRDHRSRIQALQIRLDSARPRYIWFSSPYKQHGASSGAPIHFAYPHLIKRTGHALITEGALKADVIAERSGECVIGLPGVTTFPEGFAETLHSDLPDLDRITIAFDMDWRTKPQVKDALFKLMRELRRFKTLVRTWDQTSKGYDDYLTKGTAA